MTIAMTASGCCCERRQEEEADNERIRREQQAEEARCERRLKLCGLVASPNEG